MTTVASTTSRAVAVRRDVKAALLLDEVHEGFGFLRRPRVDMAQEAVQRELAGPDQVRRIFDGT